MAESDESVTLELTRDQYRTIMRALATAHERATRVGATADLADLNQLIAAISGKLQARR